MPTMGYDASKVRKITMSQNIIKRQDGSIILIPSYLVQHIATHNNIGVGSVFSTPPSADDIFAAASSAPVTGQGGLYPVQLGGYNLVLSLTEALKLPDAKQGTVKKEERNAQIEVPSVSTSAPISQFTTNSSNIVIRSTPEQYIADEFKSNPEAIDAAQQGKLYSVLSMFPGDPNIPPANKWNGQYAVILPNQQSQQPQQPQQVEQPQPTQPKLSYFLNNYIGKLGVVDSIDNVYLTKNAIGEQLPIQTQQPSQPVQLKLSKAQWQFIGQKAGWIRTAALSISYTGIVPQDSISGNKVVSSQVILSQMQIPQGWTPYANHMTINLGGSKDQSIVGQDIDFSLIAIAQDDKVMAAQVQSSAGSMNNPPHITIAVSPQGKPMMSANLKEWKPINPIVLKGKILEVLQDGTIVSNEMKQQDQAAQQQNIQAKQQAEQAKKANSPTNVIQQNKWNREQAMEYLKSKNIPQQAWENILKSAGI